MINFDYCIDRFYIFFLFILLILDGTQLFIDYFIYIYINIYLSLSIYSYIYIYLCIYIYIYIYSVYLYTYTYMFVCAQLQPSPDSYTHTFNVALLHELPQWPELPCALTRLNNHAIIYFSPNFFAPK